MAVAPLRASERQPTASSDGDFHITRFKNGIELNFDPENYNRCYSDWRKAVGFNHAQEEAFKAMISANCGQDEWQHVHWCMRSALRSGVPPTHLIIGLLYSSYHIQSPHTNRLLILLLQEFGDAMADISAVTSISNPCYNVAHVAAMTGSHELLYHFYAKGGDVDVCDARNVSPLYIAFGKSNFRCLNTLLWMNATVQLSKMLNMTRDISMQMLRDLMHDFKRFVADMKLSIDVLKHAFDGTADGGGSLLNEDCANVVIFEMLLPMNAYRGVRRLLEDMQAERGYEWNEVVEDSFVHSREDSYKRLAVIGMGARVQIHRVFEGSDRKDARSWLHKKEMHGSWHQTHSALANALRFGMDLAVDISVDKVPGLRQQQSILRVDHTSTSYSRQITFLTFVGCVATGIYIVWRQTRKK